MPTEKDLHDLQLIQQMMDLGRQDLAASILQDPTLLRPFPDASQPLQYEERLRIDAANLQAQSPEIIDAILAEAEKKVKGGDAKGALAQLIENIRRWMTSAVDSHLSLEPLTERFERLNVVAGQIAKSLGASSYSIEFFISVPPGMNIALHFDTGVSSQLS